LADDLACRELVELVTDYLEGTLSEAERARFEGHIGGCSGCAMYLDQIRETVRLAGTLREEDIDPPAREVLLAAFRDWKQR
jgi:anti-sigma factor RsiW